MSADIKTHGGVFAGEAIMFNPGVGFAKFAFVHFGWKRAAEKAGLSYGSVMAEFLRGGDGVVHGSEEAFALAESVHGSGFDEALERALVEDARIHVVAEIVHGFELTEASAGFDDGASGAFADVFNGGETETNFFADGGEI